MSSKGRNLLVLLIVCIIIIVGVVIFFKIKHKPIVGLDTIDISDYVYFVNYDKEFQITYISSIMIKMEKLGLLIKQGRQ